MRSLGITLKDLLIFFFSVMKKALIYSFHQEFRRITIYILSLAPVRILRWGFWCLTYCKGNYSTLTSAFVMTWVKVSSWHIHFSHHCWYFWEQNGFESFKAKVESNSLACHSVMMHTFICDRTYSFMHALSDKGSDQLDIARRFPSWFKQSLQHTVYVSSVYNDLGKKQSPKLPNEGIIISISWWIVNCHS